MEILHALARGVVIVLILLVAGRITVELIRMYGGRSSEKYRRRIEAKSTEFTARYEKCMVEYVQNCCHVSPQLGTNMYHLTIEIGAQSAFIGYNLFRLQPNDRALVIACRQKWYQYEQDIGRLIDVKVR